MRAEWQPKLTGETVPRYMDFSGQLAPGDSLTGSPTATATVWSGNDSDPSDLIQSSVTSGNQAVITLTGGESGTIYEVVVSVATTDGYTLEQAAYLAVVPNVP